MQRIHIDTAKIAAQAAQQPPKQKPHLLSGNGARDYSAAFRLAFDFLQKHTPPPPMDSPEWADIYAEFDAITADQHENVLAIALVTAVFEELEREASR